LARSPANTTRVDAGDHLARYVSRKRLEVCPDTDVVLGVLMEGFKLRVDQDEKELSVNHLQYFSGDTAMQLKALKADRLADGFKLGGVSVFAVIAAGVFTDRGRAAGLSIASYKAPIRPGNMSHVEVRGMPHDNSNTELLEGLAQEANKNFVESKDI